MLGSPMTLCKWQDEGEKTVSYSVVKWWELDNRMGIGNHYTGRKLSLNKKNHCPQVDMVKGFPGLTYII